MPTDTEVRTARAVARGVRISPRKARLVIDLIRGKDVGTALAILRQTPKKAAPIIEKVLRSAIANAENNHDMRPDALYVRACYVDEGPTLKRYRPRAMGRAAQILKRTSHITVIVAEKEEG
ncbi:50S ribosomal protein L22 [Hydrogenibacillus schlegelii]|uniref:Large ribosomal subunit protein uL22 n=1 Tax=Hydrogenibacillus schlegelii TaxID=1484 RepID=A0A132N3C9_HYDSH|nr:MULTISPECIES: 50S ribosomal protein L22 [Hydrogenibacillus]KWX04593.1 50S ribosomal protein L22 [Hydrogenibacillus schlegelii]MBE3563246.1 50S ribosomal protein L22 [Hydrogenibacillus schlegelii]MBT9283163.1 50S ribosomal protein L22 [Hydrogenibacillus schlegelii]OAR04449.1 50S ribosomal protein L22 [Hydrogenibacillus schlegelii]PTQ52852.1 MAG: LSU ribosomal protein L22p (L17e) [Hydrogenibacillus schlegelii]